VSTAVPVALVPPVPVGALKVTVGAVVYVPALLVIVTVLTIRRSTAVPAAPVPPPPEKATVGLPAAVFV